MPVCLHAVLLKSLLLLCNLQGLQLSGICHYYRLDSGKLVLMNKTKNVTQNAYFLIGQRHAKRDLRTCAKSVDSDQPLRLRRCVWSESALFDTCHNYSTYTSCCVTNRFMYIYF